MPRSNHIDFLGSHIDDLDDSSSSSDDFTPQEQKEEREPFEPLPHQVDAVKRIRGRFLADTPGFILADYMGLGKTAQSIMATEDINGPMTHTLVVGPLSCLHQWAGEVPFVTHGRKKAFVYYKETRELEEEAWAHSYVITNYDTVGRQMAQIDDVTLSRIRFLDHQIHLRDSQGGSDGDMAAWVRQHPALKNAQPQTQRDMYIRHINRAGDAAEKELREKRKTLPFLFRVKWDAIVLDEAHEIRSGVTFNVKPGSGGNGFETTGTGSGRFEPVETSSVRGGLGNLSDKHIDSIGSKELNVYLRAKWPDTPIDLSVLVATEAKRLQRNKYESTLVHFQLRLAHKAGVSLAYVRSLDLKYPCKFKKASPEDKKIIADLNKKGKKAGGKKNKMMRYGLGDYRQRFEAVCHLNAKFRLALTGTLQQNRFSDVTAVCVFLRVAPYSSIQWWKKTLALDHSSDIYQTLIAEWKERMFLSRLNDVLNLPRKTFTTRRLTMTPQEHVFLIRIIHRLKETYEKLREKRKQTGNAAEKRELNGHVLALLSAARLACNDVKSVVPSYDIAHGATKTRAIIEQLRVWLRDPVRPNPNHDPSDPCSTTHIGANKIIVFTQYANKYMTRLKDAILSELHEYDGKVLEYRGGQGMTRAKRQAILETFKTDADARILLISTKAGNVGLNLTEANCVILTEPTWNPFVEEQAMNRAHRYGQKLPVHIVQFICDSSIEEWMGYLHNRKKQMAYDLLGQGSGLRTKIERKVLLDDSAMRELFERVFYRTDVSQCTGDNDTRQEYIGEMLEQVKRRRERRHARRRALPAHEQEALERVRRSNRGRRSAHQKSGGTDPDKWQHPLCEDIASTDDEQSCDESTDDEELERRDRRQRAAESAESRRIAMRERRESSARSSKATRVSAALEEAERARAEATTKRLLSGGLKHPDAIKLRSPRREVKALEGNNSQIDMRSYMRPGPSFSGAPSMATTPNLLPSERVKPALDPAKVAREQQARLAAQMKLKRRFDEITKAGSSKDVYARNVYSHFPSDINADVAKQLIDSCTAAMQPNLLPPQMFAERLKAIVYKVQRARPDAKPSVRACLSVFDSRKSQMISLAKNMKAAKAKRDDVQPPKRPKVSAINSIFG